MNFEELRGLNFRDIGNWPMLPKLVILRVLVLVIVLAGALLDWKDQLDSLDAAKQQELTLREEYSSKKAKAVNYDLMWHSSRMSSSPSVLW